MLSGTFAPQEYWDASYATHALFSAPCSDRVRQFIEKYAAGRGGECFEAGCFPGRYLPVFGNMGFRLSGIDLTPRVASDLPAWLERNGFSVGNLTQGDFLAFDTQARYDVVCSFGFVEHFTDFPEVIRRHSRLVKEGGLLIVTAPNLAGIVQHLLHWGLDRKNLGRHNLAAMNPRAWAKVVAPEGFTPVFSGPFGGFQFWADRRDTGWLRKALLPFVLALAKLVTRLGVLPDSTFYSPYCGFVARKSRHSHNCGA